MNDLDFWKEVISESANGCGLALTPEQLHELADGARMAHENYGLAHHTPSPSDRYAEIDREHKTKLKEMEQAHERYRQNAETAVKQALGQYDDTQVSIGEYGSVYRHGGRTEQIQ